MNQPGSNGMWIRQDLLMPGGERSRGAIWVRDDHQQGLNHQQEIGSWDGVHPPKQTWNLKIGIPNRKVVFQPSISRGYVSFREGNWETFRETLGKLQGKLRETLGES